MPAVASLRCVVILSPAFVRAKFKKMAAEAASQLAMAMLWSRETLPTLAADPRFFRAFKDMRRNASPQQTLTELGSKKGAGRVAGDAGIMSRGNASDHVAIGIDGIGQGSEIG